MGIRKFRNHTQEDIQRSHRGHRGPPSKYPLNEIKSLCCCLGRSSSVPPFRAGSVPAYRSGSPFREMTMPRGRSPFRGGSMVRGGSPFRSGSPFRALSPLRALSVDRLDNILDSLDVPHVYTRALSPTPIKAGRWAPRASEVAYNYDGNVYPVRSPLYSHHPAFIRVPSFVL